MDITYKEVIGVSLSKFHTYEGVCQKLLCVDICRMSSWEVPIYPFSTNGNFTKLLHSQQPDQILSLTLTTASQSTILCSLCSKLATFVAAIQCAGKEQNDSISETGWAQ